MNSENEFSKERGHGSHTAAFRSDPDRDDEFSEHSSITAIMPSPIHGEVSQISQAVDKITLLPNSAVTLREHATTKTDGEKLQPGASHSTLNHKKKKWFGHIAQAYQEAPSGNVRVPRCLLRNRPILQRLMTLAQTNPPSTTPSTEPEIQAIRNLYPPVTKDSLKELELPSIQNNLTLRIDLCFDQGLYFQPVSGNKGDEKQRHAKIYWDSLLLELQTHLHVLHGSCQDCGHGLGSDSYTVPSRLSAFFTTLRDLLEILVPEADKEDVKQWLDIDWLVRLVRIGQFDASRFSEWLSKLLMSHCAPMRDEMAQDMHRKVSAGAQTGNMEVLVEGLTLLFTLLEKMKLDVANHQIRSFKFLLIADTIPFLKDCFTKMIDGGQFDISSSRSWVQNLIRSDVCNLSASILDASDRHFEIFVRGIARLATTSRIESPDICVYDKDRMDILHMDFVDLVQWQICEKTLEELMLKWSGRSPTASEIEHCLTRVLQLIVPEEGYSEGVDCHARSVAIEIARAAAGISSSSSDTSTIPTSSSSSSKPRPRSQPKSIDLQFAISRLKDNLKRKDAEVAEQTARKIDELVLHHAHRFKCMETLQVSEDQRAWTVKRSAGQFPIGPDLEDVARRLAHIAILSWQVWSDLLLPGDA